MRWQSDWLYQLIAKEIGLIWQRAVKDGAGSYGPAPDYLIATQFSSLSVRPNADDENLQEADFVMPAIKHWRFDAVGMRVIANAETKPLEANTRRGMFYQVGHVGFGISANRKLVAVQFVVGPLYGAHRVYKTQGQGKTGRLEGAPGFVMWIS